MTEEYFLEPFPPIRRATVDLLAASSRKHMIHGLIELDVTSTRQVLRAYRRMMDQAVSLSSYLIYCCARAVEKTPHVQAYRDYRNRLYIFKNVDVAAPVEREIAGNKEIVPCIIREANLKSPVEIQNLLNQAQTMQVERSRVFSLMKIYVLIPRFIRKSFFRFMDLFPKLMKKNGGTVMVSSLNMFGDGTGWGIPLASHTLNLTLGGMTRKPVVVGDKVENHEFLCVTVSIDHDLVDSAPAARFIHDFKELVEKSARLEAA